MTRKWTTATKRHTEKGGRMDLHSEAHQSSIGNLYKIKDDERHRTINHDEQQRDTAIKP